MTYSQRSERSCIVARLTIAARDNILRRVLDFKFKKRLQDQKNKGAELFDKVVDLMLGKYKETVESLPDGWIPLVSQLQIDIDGTHYYISGHHPRRVPDELPQYFRFTKETVAQAKRRRYMTAVEAGAAVKLLLPWVEAQRELQEERDELEHKIRALLYSVTSDKRLYEAWPELHEIIPFVEEDVRSTGTSLTVSVAD